MINLSWPLKKGSFCSIISYLQNKSKISEASFE